MRPENMPDHAFDISRLAPNEQAAWNDMIARYGIIHATGNFEHVVHWVHFLRACGRDAVAIRNEVNESTRDGITQIYLGREARTMTITLARAMVEQALSSQAED
jgi:hypothetical protein